MSETKRKIASSFMKLLETRPYAKISVNHICEATPVSRNSFYYHFEGKEAVIKWIITQHYLKYCLPYFKIREGNISTKSFFQYILEYRTFYNAVFQIDQGQLLQKCLREAYDMGLDKNNVVEYSKPKVNSKERVSFQVCTCYCNAGTAAVVTEWIEDGMKAPVEKIAYDLSMMMTNSLEEIRDYHLY